MDSGAARFWVTHSLAWTTTHYFFHARLRFVATVLDVTVNRLTTSCSTSPQRVWFTCCNAAVVSVMVAARTTTMYCSNTLVQVVLLGGLDRLRHYHILVGPCVCCRATKHAHCTHFNTHAYTRHAATCLRIHISAAAHLPHADTSAAHY